MILFTAINSVLHVPRNWSIALTYVQGTCYTFALVYLISYIVVFDMLNVNVFA